MNRIRLKNSITGLFYVQGRNFTGLESEATVYDRNSPEHLVVRHTFDNVVEVEVSTLRRYTLRRDGIEKIERKVFGATGKNIHGEAARGWWVTHGFRKDGIFRTSLNALRQALNS